MRKRLLIGFLGMCLCVSFIGCGSNSSENNVTTSSEIEAKTQEETTTEQETLLSRDRMTYTEDITYDTLARYPKQNIEKPVKFTGKIVQVVGYDSENDATAIRLAVNDDHNKILYVIYYNDIVDFKLLENDKITIYGAYIGEFTYNSTFGKSITIPQIQAVMVDLHQE